ncbi:unnamed protein product [Bathycoccus prasinos]
MVKLTMIARVLDGLPLAEGLDTDASLDLEYYKQQAKTLFKKLGQNSSYSSGAGGAPPSRMSYESGEYFMHYVIESGNCNANSRTNTVRRLIPSLARTAFIKFDTFIQKTKKLYSDQRTQRNLEKLNEDLHDIQSIMTRNINDVLEQGERLDRVENMSGNLAMESKKYAKKAKDLSRQALIQKYMPVIVLVGLFICVYGFRRFFAAA